MTIFSSRSLNPGSLGKIIKKHPSVFGVPFILVMVAASFGLSTVTQIRYDLHDQKVKAVRVYVIKVIANILIHLRR